jgi:hypothetical protein
MSTVIGDSQSTPGHGAIEEVPTSPKAGWYVWLQKDLCSAVDQSTHANPL